MVGVGADVVTAATPMAYDEGGRPVAPLWRPMISSPCSWATSAAPWARFPLWLLLIGGIYLIARKVITWHIPVAYLGTVAVLTFLFPRGNDPLTWSCSTTCWAAA